MNRDSLKGQWMQLKGTLRKNWGKLTDDDIELIEGDADLLIGKLQERYGMAREAAEKELEEWQKFVKI